jgi:ornithine--oxo-acid transaminase
MNKSQEYIELENRLGANNYKPLDVVIEKGEGAWVWDVDGKKYLDCLAAYSAVNQGHCHPHILKAFTQQAEKVTLTSRAFRNDQLPKLYQKLNDMTGYDLALPMNSGAEAVETAIKAARRWAYRTKGVEQNKAEILVASDNFHGRTTTIVGFSNDEVSRADFGPFTPGFVHIEYGNIDSIKNAINKNTAAILIEPIQGEAGVIIPEEGFLKAAYDLCKENNVLFIADEIQAGLGRSGKMFAHQWEGITPDLVILGKALSGGFYPVSAVIGSKEVLGLFDPGSHGSTFGGNPLGSAVAVAALEVIENENLIENSNELGNYFLEELRKIDSDLITEVRGRGLWIGVDLKEAARQYCYKLKDLGILCKDTREETIRIAPPLVISKEDIDWAVKQFKAVLGK